MGSTEVQEVSLLRCILFIWFYYWYDFYRKWKLEKAGCGWEPSDTRVRADQCLVNREIVRR